jgi:hypothetical protein
MARHWSPKYWWECPRCGWRGQRTRRIGSGKKCPRCNHYPVVQDAILPSPARKQGGKNDRAD